MIKVSLGCLLLGFGFFYLTAQAQTLPPVKAGVANLVITDIRRHPSHPSGSKRYGVGDQIVLTVTFTQSVQLKGSGQLPQIQLQTAPNRLGLADLNLVRQTGSDWQFLYTVKAGDNTEALTLAALSPQILTGDYDFYVGQQNLSDEGKIALPLLDLLYEGKPVVLDSQPPRVEVVQSGQRLVASSPDNDFLPTTWRVAQSLSAPDCSDRSIFDDLGQVWSSSIVDEALSGQWFCFKVSDQAGNTGYKRHLVSNLIVTQTRQKTIVAQAQDLKNLVYEVLEPGSLCQATSFGDNPQAYLSPLALVEANHDQIYCFRADDLLEQVYSYTVADLSPPEIATRQNSQGQVLAQSTEKATWRYAQGSSLTACLQADDLAYESGQLLRAQFHGQIYCFKATDAFGNQASSNLVVDLEPATIKVVQTDNGQLTVSAQETLISWRYQVLPAGDQCLAQPDSQALIYAYPKVLKVDQDGQIYCFWATDAFGNLAKADHKVDLKAPLITISHPSNNQLIAQSSEVLRNWQVVTLAIGQECNRTTDFLSGQTYSQGEVLLVQDSQDSLFCFRAADQSGNYGYASQQIGEQFVDQAGGPGRSIWWWAGVVFWAGLLVWSLNYWRATRPAR